MRAKNKLFGTLENVKLTTERRYDIHSQTTVHAYLQTISSCLDVTQTLFPQHSFLRRKPMHTSPVCWVFVAWRFQTVIYPPRAQTLTTHSYHVVLYYSIIFAVGSRSSARGQLSTLLTNWKRHPEDSWHAEHTALRWKTNFMGSWP